MATPVMLDLPDALSPLQELALDLRWTWSHEADELWRRIDEALWERTRSPWTMLQRLGADRTQQLAADQEFLAELAGLLERRRAYLEMPTWFGAAHPDAALGVTAYFSMEFGLGSALPLYAGGLGVLSGDFLKASSDLGVPVVGVGLLYQEGYFRQVLDADGRQHEAYPYNEPATMPIEPVMVDGAWLRAPITLPGRILQLRVWQASVGRVKLYLLDSNDILNSPADRGVTGQLYGGDAEKRLMHALILGFGGWRTLQALGLDVKICHINEGHAAFAVIERACALATSAGLDFQQALWASRAGNIFTTHTPVAAGFDRYDPELLRKYLPSVAQLEDLGVSLKDVLALGRGDPEDDSERFNMANLAVRGSAMSFGVSRLHAEVSRRIFQPLFPRWPAREVPIGHVTNGVHAPTWDSQDADELWTKACGKERWRNPSGDPTELIKTLTDEEIWDLRGRSRQILVDQVRQRLAVQLRGRGLASEEVRWAHRVLDPNVLTLGFARRFAEYKRSNLLLHDKERFVRILSDRRRPLQIVVAGKAHPVDAEGKEMIREWVLLARDPRARRRIVFLEDYDIDLAQQLVRGVDVWISTPRRPWEACGTSGMKVLVNGGLNLSVRDGWWDEAYEPDLGWLIGDGRDAPDEFADAARIDAADSEAAYRVLETLIVPEFYDRDPGGLPRAWVSRIRRSMSALTYRFSSARMVRQYVEEAYLPAVDALARRSANGHALSKILAARARLMKEDWPNLHVGQPAFERDGEAWLVSVPVYLGDALNEDVRLELYAEPQDTASAITVELSPCRAIPGSANGSIYTGRIESARPAGDFTVRLTPSRSDRLAGELPLMLWQE